MKFGITIKPDMSPERIVALTRQAEACGFGYGWIFDSHVLWLEPYPMLTLMATNTKKMRLGTCVTNPATRDITVTSSLFATLNLISGGRMQLGIGRGDSSRRVLGKKPVTSAQLGDAVQAFRNLTGGKETEYDGQKAQLSWATGGVPPVWVAGYGPKVLELAGRIADGVILQFADPDLIEWCVSFVKKGADAAGRDSKKIEVMAAAPVWLSDNVEIGREHVRWFPALVSNHVVDLVSRCSYDDLHHCKVDSSNRNFVSDEVTDRFCLLGNASAHIEKIRRLQRAGVTQFNIYLMCGDEEDTLEKYKKEVLPSFRANEAR
jgi:probable F420-dependent oxidoreductase